jgi:hypothetical protein
MNIRLQIFSFSLKEIDQILPTKRSTGLLRNSLKALKIIFFGDTNKLF